MNPQDEVNRGVWSKTKPTDWLARGQGFTDEGERHAFCTIMDQMRNAPILDIGVGPGRTIPMSLPSPSAGRAMYVVELYHAIKGMPRRIANYKRAKGMSIDSDGWSTGPFEAHQFGLVTHYTTLSNQLAELVEAGFEAEPIVYGNDNGQLIRPSDPLRAEHSFTILARKRLPTPSASQPRP